MEHFLKIQVIPRIASKHPTGNMEEGASKGLPTPVSVPHTNLRLRGDIFWAGSPGCMEVPRKRLTLKMKILGQGCAKVNEKFQVGR